MSKHMSKHVSKRMSKRMSKRTSKIQPREPAERQIEELRALNPMGMCSGTRVCMRSDMHAGMCLHGAVRNLSADAVVARCRHAPYPPQQTRHNYIGHN